MKELEEQIEELKERLECAETILAMKNIPDAIHLESLRSLLPEYIEDLNSILKNFTPSQSDMLDND